MQSHGRKAERIPLQADIDFRRTGEHRWKVNIVDISLQGCRVELPVRVKVDDTIWVTLPGAGGNPGQGLLGGRVDRGN